jgi:hypothetical protein
MWLMESSFPAMTAVGTVTAATGALLPVALALPIGVSGEVWDAIRGTIFDWYVRAPALVLGLAILLAVPPLAVLGFVLVRRAPVEGDGETYLVTRTGSRSTGEPTVDGPVLTEGVPGRPQHAWVEISAAPGGAAQRFALNREVVRIGRDPENDIVLSDMTVHRYHAAIHRAENAEYVITDLSSEGGNGVTVSGNRVARVRLRHGDVIELGDQKLTFAARPI